MEQSYYWVMSCIESSFSSFQFKCCFTLIQLFEAKYKDEELARHSITELYTALDKQEIKYSVLAESILL